MRRTLSLLVGLMAHGASLPLLAAAPLTVTILADSGPGSLRDQVAAAAPGDTIDFDAALDGKTILLTSGSIEVDKELTIDASALSNRILLSGNNSSRIFTVQSPGELSLESLILKDGNDPSGGAIRNNSTLSINRCSLHNNSATFGGALSNAGTLTLTNSTLYSNSATTAGALYAASFTPATVINSTFSLNSATGEGGAIFVTLSSAADLLNCTVSDNTAAGNGGGIRVESVFGTHGDLTLRNTIVAGNNSNVVGPIDQNLFSIISGDPLLMPFANYGGPTRTMPPLVQSPAVDGGAALTGLLPTDQLGNPRTVNDTPDIGAVELQPPHFFPADGAIDLSSQPELIWFWEVDADSYEIFAGTSPGALISVLTTTDIRTSDLVFTPGTTHFWRVEATTGASTISSAERSFTTRPVLLVTTDADENDPGLGLGAGDSLREVIAAAASQPGKDVIEFDAGLNGMTLVLGISSLNVTGDLLIDASSLSSGVTISGGNALPMFFVSSGGDLTLRSISFINGFSAGSGGAITNLGNLEIQQCSFANSSSQSSGGALSNSGTLAISNSTFVGNSAAQASFNHGGAIRSTGSGSSLHITNSTLTGNTAGVGGAISTTGGMVAFNNTIVGNTASIDGGGLELTGTNEATNTIITDNTAPMDPDLKGTLTTSTNNFLGGAPLLSQLAFNGGNTQTILPLPHSPVIDAGTNNGALPSTDQRGQPRVQHLLVDLGAVEVAAPFFLPADTETGVSADTVLAWYFDPGADSFELFLGTNPGALSSIGTTANRSITPASLTTGQTYFWRVDATTGASTVSSATLSFTVRPSPVVTTALDENDGALGMGTGDSLREALEASNTLVGVDTITFAAGLDGQTITLNAGELSVTTELSIDASMLPNGLTIDGGTASRILHISAAAQCSLDSLHLTRANASGGGGAVLNDGSLNILCSTISQCFSLASGGAIENSGSLTIENSTLAENAGLFDGGALSNLGSATIRHSTLSANEAFFGSGGGVSNQGTLTLENSIVAANTADSDDNLSGSAPTQLGNNLTSGNPRIAPLGDYGSPPASMPPLPGSPVIEGAILLGSTPPTDQHGNSRPSGPLPDLGAIEAAGVAPLLSPLPDTDGDGIADILEGFSGPYPQFTVGIDDSLLDTDGDRIPDAQELRDMSDPLDHSDSFRLLGIAPAPGFNPQSNPLVEVTVKTFPGFSYEFETDATLLNFQALPGSQFTATDFQTTFQILLGTGGDFVRGRRN